MSAATAGERHPDVAPIDDARLSPAPLAHDFRPGTTIRVPTGAKARVHANMAVIDVLERLDAEQRPATAEEHQTLATWSGWGAVPEVFDRRNDSFADERAQLQSQLNPEHYRAAEASILNAHYTDPAIAAAMWNAVTAAGFTGGRVLEPGCGSGTFIGLAPQGAVMIGVENDPITAKVAAALYPSAQIRSEGYETTRVPGASFAAVLGNVPFGQFTVYDPAHNPERFSIHNHFIIKSLDLTAPGGYAVVLTSRYTLDNIDSRARRAIAARADLLGAIRLPTKAFHRVAGTDVVTDILVLRRRETERAQPDPHWIDTEDLTLTDPNTGEPIDIAVNTYFHDHPHRVLGTFRAGHGIHGSTTLHVDGPAGPELVNQISTQLDRIVAAAREHGYGLTAHPDTLTEINEATFDPGLITPADQGPQIPLDTLRYDAATTSIQRWTGHTWVPQRTPKTLVAETRKLIELRDAATAVIAAQRHNQPAADREQLRGHLNHLYDRYVEKHGPINRFRWVYPSAITQERHDKKVAASEERWRKSQAVDGVPYRGPVPDDLAQQWDEAAWNAPDPYKRRPHLDGGIKNDPGWAIVAALEIFDENTGAARKAPIFSVDLLTAPTVREHAETIDDALAISFDTHHRVDVDHIASLLGCTVAHARHQLSGLVYPSLDDPDELVPAVTALSGNVRTKLARAAALAENNPAYTDYAAALRAVLPPDKQAAQIRVRPGAPWIGAHIVAQFAKEILGAGDVKADHLNGQWSIECPRWQRNTVAMTETFGTSAIDAIDLLNAVCNSKPVVIERPKEDIELRGGPKIDVKSTFAAQAKAAKISEEFSRWVFAEDQRREQLVTEFNRRFNSLRAPRHRGDKLQLPGLSRRFEPHPYQRDAVARIIAEPTVLLDHVVGAGKTGTMFMAAMELRRLGLVKQPWIVVPNHLIEQFGREAKQWYPAANILLGAANTDPDGRRRLAAQSAATDWDMVIVPQSLFTAIGVSDDIKIRYINAELDAMTAQRQAAQTDVSKKRLELAEKKARAKLEELTEQAKKDTGLRFEQTGCDYLFIDEAHLYKNKGRISNIEELSCPTAARRAEDLAMKLDLLRQRRRDEGLAAGLRPDQIVERVATFATGTPIANSLGELWVMQNYLRPDLLEAAGVANINDWGATFTTTTSTVEVNATGTSLRPVTRVGRFCNLSRLLSISSVFTDVVTRDQVPMDLPEIAGGKPHVVTITPSQEVIDFIADLGWRADNIDTAHLERDNILKISNDGRNVTLDPRLAHLDAPQNSRAAHVAERAIAVHNANADRVYLDPDTGQPMPRPGALQIMFCDRGTPAKDPHQFTIYQAIKDELIARGMPAQAIRFIHDAVKPADKLRLFHDCIHGEVSVLLGSTEKMGTGTNVQTRLRALHNIDVPWRPADLEQRYGRIIRQGNQNKVVDLYNYVTEGSYDPVMWQKVEAKYLFIEQTKRQEIDTDEIEDIGGPDTGGAAAAETKAIATGDPRYIRQVQLDDEVKRLQALESAHHDAAARRDRQIQQSQRQLAHTAHDIETLAPILHTFAQHAQRPAQLQVNDTTYPERKDAAEPFAAACRHTYTALRDRPHFETKPLGATINGIEITARRSHVDSTLLLSLDVPSAEIRIKDTDLHATTPTLALGQTTAEHSPAAKARGLLQRVENLYKDLPAFHQRLQQEQRRLQTELDDLHNTDLGQFEHADQLHAKREELAALTAELRIESESQAAKTAAAAAQQRLLEAGREPGWSLHLNPTPALIADAGLPDADSYRFMQQRKQRARARDYATKQLPGHGHTPGLDL